MRALCTFLAIGAAALSAMFSVASPDGGAFGLAVGLAVIAVTAALLAIAWRPTIEPADLSKALREGMTARTHEGEAREGDAPGDFGFR